METEETRRAYITRLAYESGGSWLLRSDENTDIYSHPPVVTPDGGPDIEVADLVLVWRDDDLIKFQGQDIPEFGRCEEALGYIFGDAFGDPSGIDRFGIAQIREWEEDEETGKVADVR